MRYPELIIRILYGKQQRIPFVSKQTESLKFLNHFKGTVDWDAVQWYRKLHVPVLEFHSNKELHSM